MIITRNDTGDIHRFDSRPNPNWYMVVSILHTHPHASKIVQFSCITESNMVICLGDFTATSGWRS